MTSVVLVVVDVIESGISLANAILEDIKIVIVADVNDFATPAKYFDEQVMGDIVAEEVDDGLTLA